MAEPVNSLIAAYRQYLRGCQTENQVNAVHIALEYQLAPAELRELAAALAADPADSPGRRWSTAALASLPVKRMRRDDFRRFPVFEDMTVYTSGEGRVQDKTLVIGFAGRAQRMMVPTAVLLDCLNPQVYDVVVLRDSARAMFVRGIPGLGDNFLAMLTGLHRHVEVSSYRNAIAMGTSAGGLPAILAAIEMNLGSGISIGGQDLDSLASCAVKNGTSDEPFRKLIETGPAPGTRLVLVCASGFGKDCAAVQAVARQVPAQVMLIRDCPTHGVLGRLAKGNRLPAFLSRAFAQGLERAGPSVRSTEWIQGLPASSYRELRVGDADARLVFDPESGAHAMSGRATLAAPAR